MICADKAAHLCGGSRNENGSGRSVGATVAARAAAGPSRAAESRPALVVVVPHRLVGLSLLLPL